MVDCENVIKKLQLTRQGKNLYTTNPTTTNSRDFLRKERLNNGLKINQDGIQQYNNVNLEMTNKAYFSTRRTHDKPKEPITPLFPHKTDRSWQKSPEKLLPVKSVNKALFKKNKSSQAINIIQNKSFANIYNRIYNTKTHTNKNYIKRGFCKSDLIKNSFFDEEGNKSLSSPTHKNFLNVEKNLYNSLLKYNSKYDEKSETFQTRKDHMIFPETKFGLVKSHHNPIFNSTKYTFNSEIDDNLPKKIGYSSIANNISGVYKINIDDRNNINKLMKIKDKIRDDLSAKQYNNVDLVVKDDTKLGGFIDKLKTSKKSENKLVIKKKQFNWKIYKNIQRDKNKSLDGIKNIGSIGSITTRDTYFFYRKVGTNIDEFAVNGASSFKGPFKGGNKLNKTKNYRSNR